MEVLYHLLIAFHPNWEFVYSRINKTGQYEWYYQHTKTGKVKKFKK